MARSDAVEILSALRLEFARLGAARCTKLATFGREWNYDHVLPFFNRLYLVEQGEAEVTYEGATVTLRPGYAYLFPCQSELSLHCQREVRKFRTHFHLWVAGCVDVFEMQRPTAVEIEPPAAFRDRFHALVHAYPPHDVQGFLRCLRLLSELIEPFVTQLDQKGLAGRLGAMVLFQPVLDMVNAATSEEITVKDMAQRMGYSVDHFTQRFRQAFGLTPRKLIMRERLRRAEELLVSSSLTIQEIAFRSGFHDPYYFSRIFKQHRELSPKAFREKYAADAI